MTYAERVSFRSYSRPPQMTIADLAFRFAPVFSLAEQAFVPVSASLRVFALATRYFVFPAVALPASVPVAWRASPLDEKRASTPALPQVVVSLQARVLVAAVWLPAAVATLVGDSYFVPEWPPVDSVGVPQVGADLAQFPAASRLCVHLPDDSAPHDSQLDGSRCPALEPFPAQE
jgi:hypothetical protein